jgi:redox-sensitive transcriptional activator SoxR
MLTIGDVARRSGVAASALRFYEERGLIRSVRAGSGHRHYPRSILRRIAFIVFAQRIGLTLDEIGAELSKLPADRSPAPSCRGGAWYRTLRERFLPRWKRAQTGVPTFDLAVGLHRKTCHGGEIERSAERKIRHS